MREIKFRAWFVPTKRMHLGVNVVNTPDEGLVLEKHAGNRRDQQNLRFYSPVDDECVLMQFTGILDKNGSEIYEGDVVRWNHGADEQDQGISAVEFRAGSFCLTEPARYTLRVFCRPFDNDVAQDLEILGNMYEHPELLRSKAKPLSSFEHEDGQQRFRAS